MSTVLITGVNGFIGSHIAERFIKEGHSVRGLVRKSSDLKFIKDMGVQLYYGDITDSQSLIEPMKGCDIVIHVAALASDWGPYEEFHKINVEGTLNVANAAKNANLERMVWISTVAMYGFGRLNVKEEDEKAITKFHYNESKRIAEDKVFYFAKESGLNITAIKPGNVYGTRDHTFIEKYLEAMEQGKIAFVDKGSKKTCPVYVENLVDAIYLAAYKKEAIGETFIVTDGLDINWKQFTDKLADEMGLKRPTTSVPFGLAFGIAGTMEFVYNLFKIKTPPLLTRYRISNGGMDYTFSIEKAKRVLGWSPKVDLDEAVKRTVGWYKNRIKKVRVIKLYF